MNPNHFRRFSAGESLGLYIVRSRLPPEVTTIVKKELIYGISKANEEKLVKLEQDRIALFSESYDIKSLMRKRERSIISPEAFGTMTYRKGLMVQRLLDIYAEMDEIDSHIRGLIPTEKVNSGMSKTNDSDDDSMF